MRASVFAPSSHRVRCATRRVPHLERGCRRLLMRLSVLSAGAFGNCETVLRCCFSASPASLRGGRLVGKPTMRSLRKRARDRSCDRRCHQRWHLANTLLRRRVLRCSASIQARGSLALSVLSRGAVVDVGALSGHPSDSRSCSTGGLHGNPLEKIREELSLPRFG